MDIMDHALYAHAETIVTKEEIVRFLGQTKKDVKNESIEEKDCSQYCLNSFLENDSMINLTKHQFKIFEAVHLGLLHYYMGPHDKREVTATERAEALATIPDLPAGWMQEEQEWMLHKNPKKEKKA